MSLPREDEEELTYPGTNEGAIKAARAAQAAARVAANRSLELFGQVGRLTASHARLETKVDAIGLELGVLRKSAEDTGSFVVDEIRQRSRRAKLVRKLVLAALLSAAGVVGAGGAAYMMARVFGLPQTTTHVEVRP